MSKAQTLRALVSERLAAAAEDIFVLFERTIAEYEEELCRCREEKQRRQQLHLPSWSLNQDFIKEEPEEGSVKEEEEQLPVPVPETNAVCVKPEEPPLLQQRQSEQRREPQTEDISSETHKHSETERNAQHSSETDDDDLWGPFSCSASQMETAADGHHAVQIRETPKLSIQIISVPETSAHSGDMCVTDRAEESHLQCPFCHKTFKNSAKRDLEKHIRIHTGEKPYSCPICEKTFADPSAFKRHKRTHTGEKPYTCSTCLKTFRDKGNMNKHMRTHFRDKPFSFPAVQMKSVVVEEEPAVQMEDSGQSVQSAVSKSSAPDRADRAQGKKLQCPFCQKTFKKTGKADLEKHIRVHTGEKPFQCPICGKTFADPSAFKRHRRTHTGERPYSCSVCQKSFRDKSTLNKHMKTHTGEKPYLCFLCERTFTQKHHLESHTRTHMAENFQM